MRTRTLTVKGIPDRLYRKLKESAARHRRSMNSESILCLERSLGASRADPEAFLASIDALRDRYGVKDLTDESLRRMRDADRP